MKHSKKVINLKYLNGKKLAFHFRLNKCSNCFKQGRHVSMVDRTGFPNQKYNSTRWADEVVIKILPLLKEHKPTMTWAVFELYIKEELKIHVPAMTLFDWYHKFITGRHASLA